MNRRLKSPMTAAAVLAMVLMGALPLAAGAEAPGGGPKSSNYARPFETPVRPALLPLPPGAIEPAGWLRAWALKARDGYTGHMDEVHPDFVKAWAADYRMTGDKLSYWDRGAWPYEGGGYWFDGLIRLGYALHDDFLLGKARSRLGAVIDNMNEKGILFLWWLDKNDPADLEAAGKQAGGEAQAWPIWANGLLGRSIAAWYAGSGDRRALRALELAYGGHRLWMRGGWSFSNLWPAYETWTWTGSREIGEALTELFAKNGIEGPDANVDLYRSWYNRMPDERIPWYRQPDHGVHSNESIHPWAAGYLWTGNRAYLDAPSRWYEIIERGDHGMQPHGVPVSDEGAGPTGSFRGTETCNVAGYMWSQIVLLRVSGQGVMGDRIERSFFNAGPAVVSRDFKAHVYFQSPNRIDRELPGAGHFLYEKTHWPLCCTASLNRFLPNFLTHMWMATQDDGLAAVCYGPCRVSALAADRVPVELECRTDYPFDETIEIEVKPAREARFPLSFRVPGWCRDPRISLDGDAVAAGADAKGFVRIERLWKRGDRIRLRFPMAVRVRMGHDNDAADTPYAAVSCGPLLFALPIAEASDPNTPDPAARWKFALDAGGEGPDSGIRVERGPLPEGWCWGLDAPVRLRARARSFDWKSEVRKAGPVDAPTMLPKEPVAGGGEPEDVVLVPYGCAKFRISMFPVTEDMYRRDGQHGDTEKTRRTNGGERGK
jgi:hypothetical protein